MKGDLTEPIQLAAYLHGYGHAAQKYPESNPYGQSHDILKYVLNYVPERVTVLGRK